MATNPKKELRSKEPKHVRELKGLIQQINQQYKFITFEEKGSGGYSYEVYPLEKYPIKSCYTPKGSGLRLPLIKGISYNDIPYQKMMGSNGQYYYEYKFETGYTIITRKWVFHKDESTLKEPQNISWNGSSN
jgi:hypothetical protein